MSDKMNLDGYVGWVGEVSYAAGTWGILRHLAMWGWQVQSGMKLCGNLWLCGLFLEIRCEAVWVESELMRYSTMWADS